MAVNELDDVQNNKAIRLLILYSLMHSYIEYAEFENEVRNKNRFIPTETTLSFFDKIKEHLDSTIEIMPEGKTLYRARIIGEDYIKKEMEEFWECVIGEKLERKDIKQLYSNPSAVETAMMIFLPFLIGDQELMIKLKKYIKSFLNRDFQGYEVSKCLAPPAEKTPEGRLNPKNISYLYTAEKSDTAIYEVKPIIGQKISVATLKTTKELKLLDLTRDAIQLNDKKHTKITVIQVIAEQFQKPKYNDELQYIPTQYIAEYMKELYNFDGIKFKSSLNKGGINIVLFDPKCCDVIGSKIYNVDNIEIISHKLDNDLEKIYKSLD